MKTSRRSFLGYIGGIAAAVMLKIGPAKAVPVDDEDYEGGTCTVPPHREISEAERRFVMHDGTQEILDVARRMGREAAEQENEIIAQCLMDRRLDAQMQACKNLVEKSRQGLL